MPVQIPESRLVEIRAEGKQASGRFVDPFIIARCVDVLERRGEVWARSVLGRDLSRRSILFPGLPFLRDGQPQTKFSWQVASDTSTKDWRQFR